MKKTLSYVLLFFLCHTSFAQTQLYTPPGQLPKQPPSQTKPITRILFIFDCSQSMYGVWNNETKIVVARQIMIQLIDSLEKIPNVELALRVYGHQSPVPPQDCNDTKLEVPFSPGNASMIRQKLRWIEPRGTTPIARSLEKAATDFPGDPTARNIIMLITDGIEACDGDPCAVSLALQKKGVMLKPFVVGVGLDLEVTKAFNCIGKVFNARDEKQLKTVLNQAVNQALNSTTIQVNLLDTYNKPLETDVTLSFYDQTSGILKYNFVHTINSKGNPDTMIIDPLPTYRLVVQTIPPVEKTNIEVIPRKHNIYTLKTPQGSLILKKPAGNYSNDLQYIIRQSGQPHTLNVQKVDKAERYLCGKYDVEILTMPRTIIKDVVIKQSQTTTLQVAQPGLVVVIKNAPAYGGVYVFNKNVYELVANLDPSNSGSETFVLQPGNYLVTYRPKNAKDVRYSIEKKVTVKSGGGEHIKFY